MSKIKLPKEFYYKKKGDSNTMIYHATKTGKGIYETEWKHGSCDDKAELLRDFFENGDWFICDQVGNEIDTPLQKKTEKYYKVKWNPFSAFTLGERNFSTKESALDFIENELSKDEQKSAVINKIKSTEVYNATAK